MTDREVPGRKIAAEDVLLRPVEAADVPLFFAHASDPEALRVAALLPEGPGDWAAFRSRWTRWLAHAGTLARTVVCEGNVVGYLISFPRLDRREVGGWFARASWGRGIATASLHAFLLLDPTRPLYARAAADNLGALRVLDRSGFRRLPTVGPFATIRAGAPADVVWVLAQRSTARGGVGAVARRRLPPQAGRDRPEL